MKTEKTKKKSTMTTRIALHCMKTLPNGRLESFDVRTTEDKIDEVTARYKSMGYRVL